MSDGKSEALLREHFERWTRDHCYLKLDWAHYDPECPPLLFVGGGMPCRRTAAPRQAPIVIVSMEPLRSKHFSRQADFARASLEQYMRWNSEYFGTFPPRVGERAQPYWRNLASFVSGWTAQHVDVNVPWSLFASSFIELPYVPMHADEHVPKASACAEPVLQELFARRAEAIVEQWPAAVFVVLAAQIAKRMKRTGLMGETKPVPLRVSRLEMHSLGAQFDVPIEHGRLRISGEPLVFVRKGPFSNWTNPKAAGREKLGRLLREFAEQHRTP